MKSVFSPPGVDELRRRFVTPHGDLTQMWSFTPESAADFEAKYWWSDWAEYEARRLTCKPDFTVNGGMDSPHLELREDSEAALHAYTRDLFAAMGDKRHFIYASSCMTSPLTPWENLVYLRDAVHVYGTLSQ